MPDLNFTLEGIEAARFTVAPLFLFKLGISNSPAAERIQTVALRCQIQIDATRRRYNAHEQEKLLDLFGVPARWSQTLKSTLWTFASVIVPPFSGSTRVDLPVPCTFDFNVASAKYFDALEGGEVPLTVMFSGTVFFEAEDGALQAAQISWAKEAKFQLPVKLWREMMDEFYPNSAWLTLRKDVFDRLYRYKMQRALPSWEQAVESLLPVEERTA